MKATMKKLRSDESYRNEERKRNVQIMRTIRQNPEYAEEERKKNLEITRALREDPEYAEQERMKNLEITRALREDPEYAEQERIKNLEIIRAIREDPEYTGQERIKNLEITRTLRKDPKYKEKERIKNLEITRALREDPEYAEQERMKNLEITRALREDPEYAEQERIRNLEITRALREDLLYAAEERVKNKKFKRALRDDAGYKEQEKTRNVKFTQGLRQNAEYRDQEYELQKISRIKKNSAWEMLHASFTDEIKEGPTFICGCCGGLWYRSSITSVTHKYLSEHGCGDEFSEKVLLVSQDGNYWLCGTCRRYIYDTRPQIPKLCLSNGFDYPEIPEVLRDLTRLEERLVSPRIPFMQIRYLGHAGQHGLQGTIVNVPNDLDICARILPRSMDDTATVPVMFMRKQCYKKPYIQEWVRPKRVYNAAMYLSSLPLYKKEGVVLCDDWRRHKDEDELEVTRTTDIKEFGFEAVEPKGETDVNQSEDESDEEAEILNPGGHETLMMQDDDQMIRRIAPGEGKIPLSLLKDLDAEVLSFPRIYAGVQRQFKSDLKVTYTDICKSEARRYDRRACGHEKLLYSCKLLQTQRVANAIALCLRKKKGGQSVKAGQLRSEAALEALISHDDGYR